jgi:hypothetical protein
MIASPVSATFMQLTTAGAPSILMGEHAGGHLSPGCDASRTGLSG